jgi:hypothetical protein
VIRIILPEDGGNPREPDAVRETDGGFVISPFSEDGDPNYKFRLDVDLVNDSAEPADSRFVIEWDDEEYIKYRKYVLLSRGDDWEKLPAAIDGTRTDVTLAVPPGTSHLSLHPPFTVGDRDRMVGELDGNAFLVDSAGKSLHGRDITVVEAGAEDARPLLVMVRVHPYESIGSYMMQGMLQWLNEGGEEAAVLLASHRFAFVPMPNPDGVAEGLCKRTVGGLDVNGAALSDEPEGKALAAYFRGVSPQATFDIHGFMHQNDGFGTTDIVKGEAIRDRLRPLPQWEGKKLNCSERQETEGGAANLGQMATTECGSVRFGGSFSWYNRDARCLREMGVELLKAYAAQFQK